jgi:hypothetical protein
MRSRRPAGYRRRRLHRQELQGQERRDPERQVDLRQRSRRRDQEGAEQGRHEGEDVRILQQGRQGLHGDRVAAITRKAACCCGKCATRA